MIKKLREQIKNGRARIKQIVHNNKERRATIKRIKTNRTPTVIFDSVDISQIPANAPAVAGYTGGKWPTFNSLTTAFPKAWRLPIAISASEDGECLDIELGDATVPQVPAWVKRQRKRGVRKPIVYCSVSQMDFLLTVLKHSGVKRRHVRVWTAHYSFHAHICGPHTCGELNSTKADATQWTDTALGRNLDQSKCQRDFFTP